MSIMAYKPEIRACLLGVSMLWLGCASSSSTDSGAFETDGQDNGAEASMNAQSPGASSPDQNSQDPKIPSPSPLPNNSHDPDAGTKPDCDCAENSDLIYTLADDHTLWKFDPTTMDFQKVGDFDCGASPFDTPFSLGVDRHSRAWVQMTPSGKIYVVDTLKDNTCTDSGYQPGSAEIAHFGMAFMDRPDDFVCEQLYMHSFDGLIWSEGDGVGKLGTMDPDKVKASVVGPINFNGGELTGTQDGRLFAFAGDPAKLVEYRASDATVIKETKLEGLSLTMAFAFAFWGGDFYFFTQSQDGELPMKSKVTKLDYSGDGSIKTILEKAPIHIVGAGVSVCAPLEPPPPA